MAVGKRIEEKERKLARERQAAAGETNLPTSSGKFPELVGKGDSRDKVGSALGISGKTYEKAKAVVEAAESEPEKYAGLVEEMDQSGSIDGAFTKLQRQKKEEKREARRQENQLLIAGAQTLDNALSDAKFATIVIDPPWDFNDEGEGRGQFGRAGPDYQSIPIFELMELPVGEYADEDCHLYLWITNRSLPKGFGLIEAWGFRHLTCVTWFKPSFGMGTYFRGKTEHLLFGVKGSQPLKRKDVGTGFNAPRGPGGHSSKPEEAYELIETCSPGPYSGVVRSLGTAGMGLLGW